MVKKVCLSFTLILILAGTAGAQAFISTADLFNRKDEEAGKLRIVQDEAIDTLISRYILMSSKIVQVNDGNYGMDGYRIQIYNSSHRNAREESNKTRADFISKFPGIASYQKYSEPGYFKVRVGDFRTKSEATKVFLAISRVYPDAYIVPDIINFPELNKN
jgi:hypothetical protein